MGIVFLVILVVAFITLLVYIDKWHHHLIFFGLIYAGLSTLWISLFIPKETSDHYRGDPGLGIGLFTLFITPMLLCMHIVLLIKNRKKNDRRIFWIHISGLTICVFTFIFLGIESGFFASFFE